MANLLVLEALTPESLQELQGIKESQLKLVEDNPFIEITDNETYEQAKKNRTALVTGRTNLEKQEKLIASKLNSFRKQVGEVTKELINISLEHEQKQQEEVKRFEAIKEEQRQEKIRKEEKRKEDIKNEISNFEKDCTSIINGITFENKEEAKGEILALMEKEIVVDEFDVLLTVCKSKVNTLLEEKVAQVEKDEEERIERERINEENERLKKQAQKRAQRAEELKPFTKFIGDYNEIIELSDEEYSAQLEEVKQTAQEFIDKEQKQKEKEYDIKVKRLEAIGYIFQEDYFKHKILDTNFWPSNSSVFDCNLVEFKDIMNWCESSINEAKQIQEQEQKEKLYQTRKTELSPYWNYLKEHQASIDWSEIPEEQYQIIYKEAKKAKEQADAQAKSDYTERQNRLAEDKEILSTAIEMSLDELIPQGENKEINDFVTGVVNPKLKALKEELLTQLKQI